jgi:hypothetical protein
MVIDDDDDDDDDYYDNDFNRPDIVLIDRENETVPLAHNLANLGENYEVWKLGPGNQNYLKA